MYFGEAQVAKLALSVGVRARRALPAGGFQLINQTRLLARGDDELHALVLVSFHRLPAVEPRLRDPDSDRLVFVWFTPPSHPEQKRPASAADFFALREQSLALEHVGTVGGVDDTANLTGGPGDLPE